MKNKLSLLFTVAVLFFGTNTFAQNPKFYIYLCLGQSNMEGNAKFEPQDTIVNNPFPIFIKGVTNEELRTKSQKNKLIKELNQAALKLSNHLLGSPKYMKYETSFLNSIHYAEVCAAYGVSKFAQQTNNKALMNQLIERYKSLQNDSIAWRTNHVDGNVYGILPFQFYQYTKDKAYLDHGLFMANSQWEEPLQNGMTNQTRYWIDDVFIVSSLQIGAYQATKNQMYLDNAALFTSKYIDSLQQKDGLFFHGPKAPIYWGRGNGWMAAGMAMTLSELSTNHKYYPSILKGYIKMMNTLVDYQNSNGMWTQVIDVPSSWDESSCTAMFDYAISTGINKGILKDKKYKESVLKAWNTLKLKINEKGELSDICVGTGQSTDLNYYLNRPKISGDFHGQAPFLWLIVSMLQAYP